MKWMLLSALIFCVVWLGANAQIGPGILKDIDKQKSNETTPAVSYYERKSGNWTAITPGELPPQNPGQDGLIALKQLVASQKDTIMAQKVEISRLTRALDDCEGKANKSLHQ